MKIQVSEGTHAGLLTLRFRLFLPGCFQLETECKIDPDNGEMMPKALHTVLGDTCRVLQGRTP